MATVAASKDDVLKVLLAGVSQNPEVIGQVETYLKGWETSAGFHMTLVEIFTDQTLDPNVRWLATVYFKNGIEKYWRRGAPNGLSKDEKNAAKEKILSHIREPVPQVATQIAVVISKIARFDCPHEWPELLPSLLHLIQSEDDLVQQRTLLSFHHVTKALASKRLAGDRKAFQDLASELYVYVLAIWNRLNQNFLQQMGQRQNEASITIEKSLLALRVLRKLTIHGFKAPQESGLVMEFIQSIFHNLKPLLEFRQVILTNESFLGVLEKYTIVHCKVLRDLLDQHPFSFVPFIRPTVELVWNLLFQVENQHLLFVSFVIQGLNLVKGLILCQEYKPAKKIEDTKEVATLEANRIKTECFTPDVVTTMARQVITRYMLLSQDELERWESNPEEFNIEESGEAWKYSLRPSVETLFVSFIHEYHSLVSSIVVAMMRDSMDLVSPTDLQGILRKDALYNAFGLAAFDLFHEVDFDQLFTQLLVQEVRIKESNYRILRRRIVWLCGKWAGVKFSTDLMPMLYDLILSLMEPGEDLVVRLTSVCSLRSVLDDFVFSVEQFLPFLERSFSMLYALLKEVTECETKIQVLNSLSLLIELVHEEMKPFVGTLVQLLPALWDSSENHDLLRCAIIATLVHVVRGIGTSTENLLSCLLPVIAFSCDVQQSAHIYLMTDGLELWLAVVECIGQSTPELLRLIENMPAVLELGTENLIVCTSILKAYIFLCPDEFIDAYGARIVGVLNEQLDELRSEGVVKIMTVMESMLVTRPEKATRVVSACLPFVIKGIYEDEETPLVLSSFFSIVSRVILVAQDVFFQAVAEVGRRMNVLPEGIMVKILEVWIDKTSMIASLEVKKLLALALSSLFTSQSSTILNKICGIFLRVCETINDLMPLAAEGDPTTGPAAEDRLVFTADQEPDDYTESNGTQSEHSKRMAILKRTLDPTFTVALPPYFRTQFFELEKRVGPATFQELMSTVDPETMELLQSVLKTQ